MDVGAIKKTFLVKESKLIVIVPESSKGVKSLASSA